MKSAVFLLVPFLAFGCATAAKRVGVTVIEAAKRSQLDEINDALAKASKPDLPAIPKSDGTVPKNSVPVDNTLSLPKPYFIPDIAPFDRNGDGKLTWDDFDINGNKQLEISEGTKVGVAIGKLEGAKRIAEAKVRVAAGESVTSVAKDELGKWLHDMKNSGITIAILAFLAVMYRKLAGPVHEAAVAEKVADRVADKMLQRLKTKPTGGDDAPRSA